jgi:hypothetical protein
MDAVCAFAISWGALVEDQRRSFRCVSQTRSRPACPRLVGIGSDSTPNCKAITKQLHLAAAITGDVRFRSAIHCSECFSADHTG